MLSMSSSEKYTKIIWDRPLGKVGFQPVCDILNYSYSFNENEACRSEIESYVDTEIYEINMNKNILSNFTSQLLSCGESKVVGRLSFNFQWTLFLL